MIWQAGSMIYMARRGPYTYDCESSDKTCRIVAQLI